MIETAPSGTVRERAILIGLSLPAVPPHVVEENLQELADLVDTAGGEVVRRFVQERDAPDAATFIGRGKAEEISAFCSENGIALAVFDDDLSPAQARNLEKILSAKIADRTSVILDIFARRAGTREAKTQVELAQYTYLLPRLTRAWSHLSRQAGGIGTRGVGETQLETDRRVIRKRIARLSEELGRMEAHRETQGRRRRQAFKIALVGYTNAGKSSLFNRLTSSEIFVENRLFATLDTTFRRMPVEGLLEDVLLIDTVGFIRKLPHHLVASFRSTLKQAAEADLLLHVVDISHPASEEQAATTLRVLSELGMDEIPLLTLLNKVDVAPEGPLGRALTLYPGAVAASALTGEGIPSLKEAIAVAVRRGLGGESLLVAYRRWPDFLAMRKRFSVLSEEYLEEGVKVLLRGSPRDLKVVKQMVVEFEDRKKKNGTRTKY